MCGISGIVCSNDLRRVDERVLTRMRDVLAHRGPDEAGIFIREGVGLAHRRLSIVDLASGHQPMSNEDDSLWIVYNGETYNHGELGVTLREKGHRYRTNCDTETILHLYEEEGHRVVDSLRGMFAFAIWDSNRRELFLARDRLGVKPLYYIHRENGTLLFASEIKSLLEFQAVVPEINFHALPEYLASRAVSGEETLFAGVRRLLPGHTLLWRDGNITIRKYWEVSFRPSLVSTRTDADYIKDWLELFRASIRMRLMADVPLGVFLSGGIDSSAIAALMSKMVDEPIKTFSVAFAEREANELEFARLVARTFNADHHEVIVTPDQFFSALPRLVWHEDEPLAHPSSVALYFVSRLASQHVKVVLTGEGSDELMAGYSRYFKTVYNIAFGNALDRFGGPWARKLLRGVIDLVPEHAWARQKLSRTFLYIKSDVESIYLDNFAVFSRERQHNLLSAELRESVDNKMDPHAAAMRLFEQVNANSLLNRLLYIDIQTYLQELLMKQDQMSMAASIESRVPFLDHKLVEFTAAMPERMKLRGWTTKYILRESMRNILPKPILSRSKMGFPVPVGAWLRGSYRDVVHEYVLAPRASSRGIFNQSYVRTLANEHMSGAKDHTERLWSLINLEMWIRQFIDNGSESNNSTAKTALA